MTPEETIKRIKTMMEELEDAGGSPGGLWGALDIGVKAIDRTIPKKALYSCPYCGGDVEYRDLCCHVCGQMLKWEGET